MSRAEKPLAVLHTHRPIRLYADRLVRAGSWIRREEVYPLEGLEARIDGTGVQMRSVTVGNVAYLSIVGPGVAITEELRGRSKVRAGYAFAAKVNAAILKTV